MFSGFRFRRIVRWRAWDQFTTLENNNIFIGTLSFLIINLELICKLLNFKIYIKQNIFNVNLD